MPKATASKDTVKRELKTAPPDGFVLLRKLSYGEILERREITSSMGAAQAPVNRAERRGSEPPSGNGEVTVKVHYSAIQQFDFSRCIVEHNLMDDKDNILDLSSYAGMKELDPKVGQEIEKYIDDLNNLDLEEDESKSRPMASVGERSKGSDPKEPESKS